MTDTSESDAVGYTLFALNIRLATPKNSNRIIRIRSHVEHEEMQFVDAADPGG